MLGVVAVFDGCTVGTTWEQLSLLGDAPGLSSKHDVQCKSNAWHCKLSSPPGLNLMSRLLVHEVPGRSTRWRLGHFVFVNQQNSQVQCWTKWSPELNYIYPVIPAYTYFLFSSSIIYTDSIQLSTSRDFHKTIPIIWKHTRYPIQHCSFPLGNVPLQLYANANVSDVESFSTHSDGTKGH